VSDAIQANTRKELAGAVLLLRSSLKALQTAIAAGFASELKSQLEELMQTHLNECQNQLSQLPPN
jgi:hypothetical protein